MIQKAIIPVAGRGTRMMPMTSVMPKAMFPLVDHRGNIYSALHIILKEVKSAGIEQVGIIVSPWQTEILKEYFTTVYQSNPEQLPEKIEYITQTTPDGFGDAVLQGKDFIGNEPFVLLLGDHLYIEDRNTQSCLAQVINAFNSMNPAAMIGVQMVSIEELSRVGAARGVQISHNIYRCTDFIEKPTPEIAREQLAMEEFPEDTFLAHCGIYVFSQGIFGCLSKISVLAQQTGKEVELAKAQAMFLKEYPEEYLLYKISGQAYDIGTPLGYARTQIAFNNEGKKGVAG